MPSLNKVILTGYLVADPELKQTQGGKSVVTFGIGVHRKYKTNGNYESDFFQVVAWDKIAETVCKYYSKGSCITICGNLRSRQYEDSGGSKRTIVEVYAEEVAPGDSKPANAAKKSDLSVDTSPNGKDVPNFAEISSNDDLPF